MAEFNIGMHCSIKDCNKLDFLPFECEGCSQVFCLEHKSRTVHDCSNTNFESKTVVVNKQKHTCSYQDCEANQLIPIVCSLCQKLYCLEHRLPEDHLCIANPAASKPQAFHDGAQKIVLKQNFRSSKSEKTAAKLILMKLKMKAVGPKNIIDNKRIYLSVTNAMDNSQHAFFVSSQWTVGKTVDYLANQLQVTNDNHCAGNEKLRLGSAKSREVLPVEYILEELIKNGRLFNGSSVVLIKLPINQQNLL